MACQIPPLCGATALPEFGNFPPCGRFHITSKASFSIRIRQSRFGWNFSNLALLVALLFLDVTVKTGHKDPFNKDTWDIKILLLFPIFFGVK
jgi:hypothetical protein